MFIIETIPLVKINSSELQSLTYFYSKKPKIGALVLIPLGKGKAMAIVIKVKTLEGRKIAIKESIFKLRPILKIISPKSVISPKQIDLALWLSDYYLYPIGITLKIFIPKYLLQKKETTKKQIDIDSLSSLTSIKPSTSAKALKPLLLWAEDKERNNFYSKAIRKTIKKKKQVLIIVPKSNQIKNLYKLSKSISDNAIKINSQVSQKQELEIWQRVSNMKVNIIIGTRKALFLPFSNLGLIIIDEEESPNYKSWDQHPRYHAKTVAFKLAQLSGAKIILGTSFPSVNSYYWTKKNKISLTSIPAEKLEKHSISIIDMREEIKKGNYSIFSDELRGALQTVVSDKDQAILFINRRGVASTVMCRDCGYVVKCPNCDGAMVFHRQTKNKKEQAEGGVLVCHHCGHREPLPSVCPKCGSWKIKYFGSGTEKVMEELKKEKLKAIRLDSFIAPKKKQQKDIIKTFQEKKYNILVGTQLIFNLENIRDKDKKIKIAGAVLVDPLLSLPEFRSPERTIHLLYQLQKMGEETIIQTYNPNSYILKYIRENDLKGFLEEEIENRKMFNYPPFSKIIKLTYSHLDPAVAKQETKKIKERLENSLDQIKILGPSPALVPRVNNKYIWNIVLKIKPEQIKKLYFLKNLLTSNWVVDVEPQSLL